MDSARGRYQYSFKAYKATSPHSRHYEGNHCNSSSNHGIFRSRIQKHTFKWRNDHYHRGNYRSRYPYRKSDISHKKSNKSAEDQEEEERKKKLNDTAKKLLNKIKTWNAEKNCGENDSQEHNINEADSESSRKVSKEKVNSDGRPKRIAHSKKAKLAERKIKKKFTQPSETKTKYDVNKDKVKDFQNRIQHKLIEEIMQMPKESLQNVLNDPKINPVMEKKMSRLVRENKPLIAQRLRALAESKMKLLDCCTTPPLLDDIDKLIDPVIETDLSVLPYELIKQMENIFQVQFDYCQNDPVSQLESATACESAIDNVVAGEDFAVELNNFERVAKEEINEDLSLYECSTDEDEELSGRKSAEFDFEHDSGQKPESYENSEINKQMTSSTCFELPTNNNIETHSSPLKVSVNKDNDFSQVNEYLTAHCLPLENLTSSLNISNQSASKSVEFTTSCCQTDYNTEDSSTQTESFSQVDNLYGAPIPKEPTDGSISSLLNEVNSIQILVNKLNERRLMIFLQLAKMNPSGNFLSNDVTKNNFIESASNGSLCLAESLKQFFSVHQPKNNENL